MSLVLPNTKSDKNIARKEKYGPISIISTNAKILNKTLVNRIQKCITQITHHEQIVFTLGVWGWFSFQKSINIIHNIYRLKQKKHMIISIEAFDNIQHQFKKKKNFQKTRNTGESSQLDKEHLQRNLKLMSSYLMLRNSNLFY